MLIVLNVGYDHSDRAEDYLSKVHRRTEVICLRGGLEMEIAQLEPTEAELFLAEYGIAEPGLHRMIRLSYRLNGISSLSGPEPCGAD